MSRSNSAYRPDIDGLRALAVLSVVLYHIDKSLLPGGFVGVDIFFVISGFLITRNIWCEMLTGRFSFATFYLRRIRRIAPAFLVMALVTVLAGAALLLPNDLLGLAKSAIWGAFSLSNLYFWRYLDTSYFAASSNEVPLLHTWSLGVEEQFYFVWPSLLVLALPLRGRRVSGLAIAVGIGIASFVCAELTNVAAQKFSYYMLPARAGELMMGAVLALWGISGDGKYRDPAGPRWLAELLATLGFGLVAYALTALNELSAFPGVNAMYPCLGSVLLIAAGGMGSWLVRAALTPRPVVAIGLISYSLYLWHWPILAYLRYFFGEISAAQAVFAVVAMFALATLSYHFVEVPARKWRGRPRQQIAILYALPTAVLGAATAILVITGGLRSLIESSDVYGDGLAKMEMYTAPASKFSYNCQQSKFDPNILREAKCVIGTKQDGVGKEPEVLLWGDSEAAHYIGVLGQVAESDGFRFRNATLSTCPPLFGGDYGNGAYKAGCDLFRPFMQKVILSGKYRTVIIGGAWSYYYKLPRFRNDFEYTLRAMAEKGVRVIIIGEAPYFAKYNRQCELRALRIDGDNCERRLVVPDYGSSEVDSYLRSQAESVKGAAYLDIRSILCRAHVCSPYLDGRPVYFNSTHLSMDGSWLIGKKLLATPGGAHWASVIKGGDFLIGNQGIKNLSSVTSRADQESSSFVPRKMPVILGGYLPDFPYHLRSQKNASSINGAGGVVLEYWGLQRGDVASRIESALKGIGYTLQSRSSSGAAVRMDFLKPGRPKLSVNVGPMGRLVPQSPDPAGMVYYHWQR